MQVMPLDVHFVPTIALSALSHRAAYIMVLDWIVGLTLLSVMFAVDRFVSRTQYRWFLLGSLVISPMGALGLLLAVRERELGRAFADWTDGSARRGQRLSVVSRDGRRRRPRVERPRRGPVPRSTIVATRHSTFERTKTVGARNVAQLTWRPDPTDARTKRRESCSSPLRETSARDLPPFPRLLLDGR